MLAIGADVSRRSDIAILVEQTVRHFGRLDVLVTNSGGPKPGLFGAMTESDWRDAIDLVLMSTVLLSMEAVPHMRRAGGGRIINITSISAKQPIAGLMLSNALRPAVTGFSKTLRDELARDNILVNCVAPGYTRTERVVELAEATAAREGISPEAVEKRTVQNIPLGRMAEPSNRRPHRVPGVGPRAVHHRHDDCRGRGIPGGAHESAEPCVSRHGELRDEPTKGPGWDREPHGGFSPVRALGTAKPTPSPRP